MNRDTSDTGSRWPPYKKGSKIGQRGSEQGTIIREEEHDDDALITLERGGGTALFAITCGIYGWMVHTVFFKEEAAAQSTFDEMKAELERIVDLIPLEGAGSEENLRKSLRNVSSDIAASVRRFP